MWSYIIASLLSGVLFGVMDGLINANPLAQRLNAVYQPIRREGINIQAGVAIDLLYGFVLAALFLLLYDSLPGGSGWLKGLGFGLMLWFLRVVMGVASQWMMFRLPAALLGYTLLSGLLEMLVLGGLYGLVLAP